MGEIIRLAKTITIVKSFRYIAKDPLQFVIEVFRLILGALALFVLIISKHFLSYIAVLLTAMLVVVPEWCLWNAITLLFMAWSIVLSMCDVLSGGVIRFLARSEDHPEAWWQLSGFEDGNGHTRVFGTFKPCASGYGPTMGAMCKKLDRSCAAASCPLATLMRAARTGRFRSSAAIATGQRTLASPSAACRKRALAQDAKCAGALMTGLRTVNGHVLPARTMRGLARSLSICRTHTIPGDAVTKRTLAEGALSGDTLSSRIIGPLTPVYPGSTVSGTHALTMAAAIVALAWTTAKASEVLLAGQTQ
jgi:hypothetical protein